MSGGGGSTAEKYAKFGAGEYSSSDFESYVDSRPDLAAAWRKIESDPSAWDSKYWIDKGATSKSAFGRAHAAEDAELYAGTYGAGGTKVVPGSPEYEAYFGDSGGTSFDSFISSPSSSGESSGGGGLSVSRPSVASSPVPSNPYYPQLVQEYEAPGLMDYSSYMPADSMFGYEQYQPWTNPNSVNESIWNYQPPTIYAGLSRAPDGSLARYTGGSSSGGSSSGRYISGGPTIGGGSESPSSSSSSSSSSSESPNKGTPLGDAVDYIIPGTKTSAQSLMDYQGADMADLIYDEDGGIERKYHVNPQLRADIVAQDLNEARKQAIIQAANTTIPVVQSNMPVFTGRKEPIKVEQMFNFGGSDLVQDQINAELARIAREAAKKNAQGVFRPRSREEAQGGGEGKGYGGGKASGRGVGEHAGEFSGL